MRVSVYFNLHRKLFSIRAEEGPSKGRVIGHAEAVTLDDVTYHVGKAGQAKVRATGKKNVHATVRGHISAAMNLDKTPAGRGGMLPWFLNAAHTNPGSDLFRAHELRAKYTGKVGTPIYYNPYTTDTFQRLRDQRPVVAAEVAHLSIHTGHHARSITLG